MSKIIYIDFKKKKVSDEGLDPIALRKTKEFIEKLEKQEKNRIYKKLIDRANRKIDW